MEKETATAGNVKKGLAKLIDLGKERGYVTYEDINTVSYTHLTLPTICSV